MVVTHGIVGVNGVGVNADVNSGIGQTRRIEPDSPLYPGERTVDGETHIFYFELHRRPGIDGLVLGRRPF
jgi:hypothetical protein